MYTRRKVIGGLSVAFFLVSGNIAAASTQENQAQITQFLNQIRKQHGVPAMMWDEKLQRAAAYQADRMAQYEQVKHSVGWGNGFRARLARAGIQGAAAENIAAGQPDYKSAFTAWMKSPGHRRNLLDTKFSHYGLAASARAFSAKMDTGFAQKNAIKQKTRVVDFVNQGENRFSNSRAHYLYWALIMGR